MEDALQANPEIDAGDCHNDDMALGAARAAKEAGRDKEMWLTGYDGLTVEALQAIQNGELEAAWEYMPFGVEGVEAAVRVLQGKSIPKTIEFPSPMITKANVDRSVEHTSELQSLMPI